MVDWTETDTVGKEHENSKADKITTSQYILYLRKTQKNPEFQTISLSNWINKAKLVIVAMMQK